jgi:hypothetical protein
MYARMDSQSAQSRPYAPVAASPALSRKEGYYSFPLVLTFQLLIVRYTEKLAQG